MVDITTKSKCVVCDGVIIEARIVVGAVAFDPKQPSYSQHDCYYCNDCGIKYHKLPKENN